MATAELTLDQGEIHPIDIVEHLATSRDWDFDRLGEDQIAMSVEGSWRTYSITLAWSDYDDTLRMICTFDMDPPKHRQADLFHVLNLANDQCWSGAFSMWLEQKLMVYKYGLILAGDVSATAEQIDQMLHKAVIASERFYPAFQLVCWGETAPENAINVAISEAYGRA